MLDSDTILNKDIFKFQPERLPKLLAHNIKRNTMIGVSNNYGFTLDVMESYYEKLQEQGQYVQAINYLEMYIKMQVAVLKTQLSTIESETDLTVKKILLIDAMELQDDIERLLKFNEVI